MEGRKGRKEVRWKPSKVRGQQVKGKRMEMKRCEDKEWDHKWNEEAGNGRDHDEQGKEGAMLGWGWAHTLTLCRADTV